MDAFFIGGPKHGQTENIPLSSDGTMPVLISISMAKDEEQGRQYRTLIRAGIEPPIGTWQLHYLRFGVYVEPVLYFFITEDGEEPLREEEE